MVSRIIVEIGPAENPFYRLFGRERIDQDARYIAIDSDLEKLRILDLHDKRHAVGGDLRDLPLQNNSVDHLWLMNVFGGFQNRPRRLPDGSLEYSLSLSDVFQELARVMKERGKIYIGELYPPIGDISQLADKDYSDFGLEKKVYKGHSEVRFVLQTMGPHVDFLLKASDYLPFFIELTKM